MTTKENKVLRLLRIIQEKTWHVITDQFERLFDRDSKLNSSELFIELPFIDPSSKRIGSQLSLSAGREFHSLFIGSRKNTIIGINESSKELVKIEITPNLRKSRTLEEEANLLRQLTQKGCVSCPKVLEFGKIGKVEVASAIDIDLLSIISAETFPYMVQEYVPTVKKIRLADILLAVLEQKNLGVYQGDLKPANIRFDMEKGICVLVDYDQAEELDSSITQLNADDYLRWCDDEEKRKYGFETWLRHFPPIQKGHIENILRNGALNLAETTLFKRQETTNTLTGVYHTLKERDIYSDGVRNLQGRKHLLDAIEFTKGEKVLDIGCNAGLICHYLHDRGCKVTGIDLDPSMIMAAGIIARITSRNIKYCCLDLDKEPLPDKFDTIMLFSVLHHSHNLEENARKIATACDRIIIECRLKEFGKKPRDGNWETASSWNFDNVNDMITELEYLFVGFKFAHNYGIGDRDRYILEFVKEKTT